MELALIIIFSTLTIILAFIDVDSIGDNVFKSIMMLALIILITISAMLIGYSDGQKQALRGKYKYKMEIKYELRDSIYTPVDTVFVEIEK